ncbi:MAG TPA: hypothetical protein V6D23_24865, partial [Candidatus Obscuribacterales bacterium]
VFPFSVRPGTRAAYMKDHVDPAVKSERVERLLALSRQRQQAWLQQWIGQEVRVLIERVNEAGIGKGYSPHYLRVHVAGCPPQAWNSFQSVRISGIDPEQEVALATFA